MCCHETLDDPCTLALNKNSCTVRCHELTFSRTGEGRGQNRNNTPCCKSFGDDGAPYKGNAMLGLMQGSPLLCHRIIDHAAIYHGERKVITRSIEGPIHTTNYAEIRARALKVAQRLEKDGIKLSDRVATLAWNTWRHLEAWYGVLGLGAIYHTVNPRLFPIRLHGLSSNHAGDRAMFTDITFVPLLEKIADKLPTIERYIVLTDPAHMPKTTLKNAVAYEEWIDEVDRRFRMEIIRREHGSGHVLHLRRNRAIEGRAVFASLQCIAHIYGGLAGLQGSLVTRRRIASRADCSCEWLVLRLLHADGRRHDGDAGRRTRRSIDLRIAQCLQSFFHRSRTDRMADAVARPGKDRRQTPVPETGRDWRIRLPARHDQGLSG